LPQLQSRLLGTLSKGVVARDIPAEIHHGSGRRPPTTDNLMLCRSTGELSAPITSSQGRDLEPCQAYRPPRPARIRRTSAAASSTRGTKSLLRRNFEGGGGARRRADLRRKRRCRRASTCPGSGWGSSASSKQLRQSAGEPTLHLQDLLRHLRPASPPEGLGIGPGSHGRLRLL
jgi:hypothetical protein